MHLFGDGHVTTNHAKAQLVLATWLGPLFKLQLHHSTRLQGLPSLVEDLQLNVDGCTQTQDERGVIELAAKADEALGVLIVLVEVSDQGVGVVLEGHVESILLEGVGVDGDKLGGGLVIFC